MNIAFNLLKSSRPFVVASVIALTAFIVGNQVNRDKAAEPVTGPVEQITGPVQRDSMTWTIMTGDTEALGLTDAFFGPAYASFKMPDGRQQVFYGTFRAIEIK